MFDPDHWTAARQRRNLRDVIATVLPALRAMRTIALLLDAVFLLLAFGVRTVVQRRRTGDTGWRLGRPASAAEALARTALTGSCGLLVAGGLVGSPSSGPAAVVGIALAAGAIVFVSVAQLQMGASWRIGVDHDERTEVVHTGLYASIRNPIYTGMVAFAVDEAVMVPGWALAAAPCRAASGMLDDPDAPSSTSKPVSTRTARSCSDCRRPGGSRWSSIGCSAPSACERSSIELTCPTAPIHAMAAR